MRTDHARRAGCPAALLRRKGIVKGGLLSIVSAQALRGARNARQSAALVGRHLSGTQEDRAPI